jgi:hypothetical protein
MTGMSIFATTLLAAALLLPNTYGWSFRRLDAASYMAALSANEPYCVIEHGFDYVGNDIVSVQAPYNTCCTLCASVADCRAWSWTDLNGGTCWLKWARGEIVVNANAKSATMFPEAKPVCTVADDTDYVGNDLARVDSPSYAGCCDLCRGYLGCRAYTWSDYQGGSCWLKSKVSQTVVKAGLKSARVYPEVADGCGSTQVGFENVGYDLINKPSTTYGGCCDMCKATLGCRAFTWTNYQGGTCWLKSRSGGLRTKEGAYSAQVYPNPDPPVCIIRPDTDYVGNDLVTIQARGHTECCHTCRSVRDCKAWSWSNYNNGTCWFKTKKGEVVNKPGVISGIV